jgi:hypothetical protein
MCFFGEKNDFDMAGGIYYYENRQEFTPYLYIGLGTKTLKADLHIV